MNKGLDVNDLQMAYPGYMGHRMDYTGVGRQIANLNNALNAQERGLVEFQLLRSSLIRDVIPGILDFIPRTNYFNTITSVLWTDLASGTTHDAMNFNDFYWLPRNLSDNIREIRRAAGL